MFINFEYFQYWKKSHLAECEYLLWRVTVVELHYANWSSSSSDFTN